MSRPPRLWAPEGIYHLTARGNNRQGIFADAIDYQEYLILLRHARAQEPFDLLAYALMPNHIHLVIQVSDGNVSAAMRQLGGTYTRYFNERHNRVGHLYQGRFYSNLVNRESYLLEVTRYVHLNPVRARLVAHPTDYPWSSYRVFLGLEPDALELLQPDTILKLFGASSEERVRTYREFVEGLAQREREMAAWLRSLRHKRLIPPRRWLP